MSAKPPRSKSNRPSADRYLRRLGACIAIVPSDVKRANGSKESDIVAQMFTKRQTGKPHEYGVQGLSGNCCPSSLLADVLTQPVAPVHRPHKHAETYNGVNEIKGCQRFFWSGILLWCDFHISSLKLN